MFCEKFQSLFGYDDRFPSVLIKFCYEKTVSVK